MKILKDPLLHFLLLGAALFGLYALVSEPPPGESRKRIVITANDIKQLKALFAKQWQRSPTANELENLIESSIREQVFYREALALGLDKDDTIVRRRLVQKMEFIVADVTLPEQPADEVLREYHAKHAERYRSPARLSFAHIYFNPDQRGARTESEAKLTLDTLRKTGAGARQPGDQGDRFMLSQEYSDRTLDEIARDFGKGFADRLKELTPGQWHGPVVSGYGLHLVYITDRAPATQRDFEEVRARVKNDYLFDLRRESNEKVYRKLRERYEIKIEDGAR